MMLLCIIAFALSIILTLHSLSVMGLAGCSAGSSCDMVTGSRWSLVLGFLPVSSLSTGLYLAAALCCLWLFFDDDALIKKALAGLSAAIAAGSLWFVYIQMFKIKAFCPYCMSSHLCGLLLFACVFIWMVRESGLQLRSRIASMGAGTAVACLFIIFQLLTTPSYRAQTGQSRDPLPIPEAAVSPVIGSGDAPCPVALLYDYQCPHCRVIHGMLEEVVERLDGEVSFVLCPSPLSPSCNPYIPAGPDRFPGSCVMAGLSLSIWNHDPEAFETFDRWLMEEIRTEEECVAKASELCAGASVDDPWVKQYMSMTLELFARTSVNGQGGIPRMVFGDKWLIPETDDPDDLVRLVESLIRPQSND